MSERFTQMRETTIQTLRKQNSEIDDTASPMPFSKVQGTTLSDLRLREENKAETQSTKTQRIAHHSHKRLADKVEPGLRNTHVKDNLSEIKSRNYDLR